MKTRIIHTKIYLEDEWFNTLPIDYKFLFIYFFTNSHIGHTGIYELPKRVIMIETGADPELLEKALKRFEKDGKVAYFDGWVCVANSMKHTNYAGEKNQKAYMKELLSIPQEVKSHFGDTLSIDHHSV